MDEFNHRFWVFDKDTGREVQLDISNCRSWEPYFVNRGWFGDLPEYTGVQTLYQHPTGHWTLVEEMTHLESNLRDTPTAWRLSDEQAAEWLAEGGFELPECLPAGIRESLIFVPGEPVDEVANEERPVEKPIWDEATGTLFLEGECIRKVKVTAPNVRLILRCFHDDRWSMHTDSPFDDDEPGKEKLRETVRQLNLGLRRIRFMADGKGQGVVWEVLQENRPDTY